MATCFICNRALKDPNSAKRGYGNDCAKKFQRYLAQAGTTPEEIAILLMHEDSTVRRWAEIARRAMTANLNDAQRFIESARNAARVAASAQDIDSFADAA